MPFSLEMRGFHPVISNKFIKKSMNTKDHVKVNLGKNKSVFHQKKSTNLMGIYFHSKNKINVICFAKIHC